LRPAPGVRRFHDSQRCEQARFGRRRHRADRRRRVTARHARAVNTVLIFASGLVIASLALLADLIVRSRGDT
jgi:hypothetical protein